jgi:hypothetical protein
MSRNRQVQEMSLLRLAPYVSGARGRPDLKIHRVKAAAAAGLPTPLCALEGEAWSYCAVLIRCERAGASSQA